MGGITENIVQLAEAISIDGTWMLTPDDTCYLRFTPDAWPEEGQLNRDHPVFTRHTNRFRYRPEPISNEVATRLQTLQERDCHIVLFEEKSEIAQLARLIRRASSMRFRNRILHKWFGETLRFTEAEVDTGTGLDVATIELPPGGKALLRLIMDWRRMYLLNRLGMYHLLSGIESQAIAKSPALMAVLGPPDAAIDAGRLMERAWLSLEQLSIAAQPYYVLPDQLVRANEGFLPRALIENGAVLEVDSRTFFGEQRFPHMLFRIGHANSDVRRAKRLPVTSLVTETQKQRPGPSVTVEAKKTPKPQV
jgi:hypothetical protein